MTRQTIDKEYETSLEIMRFIQNEAMQINGVPYYAPSYVAKELNKRGYTVTERTIARRYEALGIVYKHGLWIKELNK